MPNRLYYSIVSTKSGAIQGVPEVLFGGMCNSRTYESLGQSILYPAFVQVGQLIGSALSAHRDGHDRPFKLTAFSK